MTTVPAFAQRETLKPALFEHPQSSAATFYSVGKHHERAFAGVSKTRCEEQHRPEPLSATPRKSLRPLRHLAAYRVRGPLFVSGTAFENAVAGNASDRSSYRTSCTLMYEDTLECPRHRAVIKAEQAGGVRGRRSAVGKRVLYGSARPFLAGPASC